MAASSPASAPGAAVKYRPMSSGKMLARNMMIYGLGGVVTPFIGIKLIDTMITPVLTAMGI